MARRKKQRAKREANGLTEKAALSLSAVVEKFRSGDLSSIVEVVGLRVPDGFPPAAWSFRNRVIVHAQADTLLCAGFRQWEQWNRRVKKGGHASFILRPSPVYERDTSGNKTDEVKYMRYMSQAVFGVNQTEVDEGKEDLLPDYEPKELPPLADVARKVGINVEWTVTGPGLLGWCTVDGQRIRVGTGDDSVFFHELGHAALDRLPDQPKDKAQRETVAEFTSAVLMHLYGRGDRTGNAWNYISGYNKDPLKAVEKALGHVEKVLTLIGAWEQKKEAA